MPEDSRQKVAALLNYLTEQSGQILFRNQSLLARVAYSRPDRLDEIHEAWDRLGRRLERYLEGKVPWQCENYLTEKILTFPGAEMQRPGSEVWEPLRVRTLALAEDPDVLELAREFYLLCLDVAREFDYV